MRYVGGRRADIGFAERGQQQQQEDEKEQLGRQGPSVSGSNSVYRIILDDSDHKTVDESSSVSGKTDDVVNNRGDQWRGGAVV